MEKANQESGITWAMDIFSTGCVVAELFLETPIFNLSQLYKYKEGDYDPVLAHLDRIDDPDIRDLIIHMIQVDPESRYSADEYLNFWRRKTFPEYFYTFLHQYMYLLTDPRSGQGTSAGKVSTFGDSDERIDRVYYDFDKITYFLGHSDDEKNEIADKKLWVSRPHDPFPLHLDIPNKQHVVSPRFTPSIDDGTLLFLNLVTASLRSTAKSTTRLRACELLLAFAERCSDDIKLDRILPFVMVLLSDRVEIVRVAALKTLTQLVSDFTDRCSVYNLSGSDGSCFSCFSNQRLSFSGVYNAEARAIRLFFTRTQIECSGSIFICYLPRCISRKCHQVFGCNTEP